MKINKFTPTKLVNAIIALIFYRESLQKENPINHCFYELDVHKSLKTLENNISHKEIGLLKIDREPFRNYEQDIYDLWYSQRHNRRSYLSEPQKLLLDLKQSNNEYYIEEDIKEYIPSKKEILKTLLNKMTMLENKIDEILNKISTLTTKNEVQELKNQICSINYQCDVPIIFDDEKELNRAIVYLFKEGLPVEITPTNIIIISSFAKEYLKKEDFKFSNAEVGYLSEIPDEKAEQIRNNHTLIVNKNIEELKKKYPKKE